ncbi:MAG TPA: hypothetical protein VD927_09100 [Chryseosolibacter sp.]|nr:hypothetical protein [Chryseosolibacter sp.]
MLYNIDSLLNAQVNFLTQSKAKLEKNAIIGDETERQVYTPADSTAWSHELEIFRKLNEINKPVSRGSYLVDDGLFDPASNLTVKAFSAVEDLPVKYVRISYSASVDKPRKIEALYDDRNQMYASGRLMTLEFHQIKDKSVLTSYSVEGGQKIILGDSVRYVIHGKITVD